MEIDEGLVRKIAELARLELTEEEVHEIAPQLRRIFEHVDRIQQLEVGDADPATQDPIDLDALRADDAGETLDPDSVLRNAPAHDDGFFVVPRFFDEEVED
ncbi:MAG: Asp-tRNA(Asn)/Glu-tRNA(Gln) amidotransferase subunit GatC [Planctomycetota bacterium]|nr:Asp-tRNA(Asn)/Glu-tRNA(Gln) amidotransferase subunit GatC [Planctomycetota bacterium]